MTIRYTKFTDDNILCEQSDNELIIKSCFVFCKVLVRAKVKKFLETNQKQLTLIFDEYRIRLEKR